MKIVVCRPLIMAGLVSGCSLSTVETQQCTTNVECRDVFGFGSTCTDAGFCELTTAPARCALTDPPGLTLPLDTELYHLFGTVFDHTLDTHIGRYRSAALAISQANANGGIDGKQFALLHCTNEEGTGYDELPKAEASVAVATWLADEVGAPAIIGPAASSDVEATYNGVSTTYGTLIISPSATSPSLTPLDGLTSTDDNPGLLWRTAPPDDTQALAIAADMRDRGVGKVAVIYQNGAYGEGLEQAFTKAYSGDSTSIPFDSTLGPADATATVVSGGYEEVLFASSESGDVVSFLLALDGINGNIGIFLTDAARNADVLTGAASASALFPLIRGTAPATPTGEVFDSFAGSYASAYGGEDVTVLSYTAQSFDAAWLAMFGTAWATSNEPEISGLGLARGLRKISSGVALDIRPTIWNEIKARFDAGESVDITGASGPLDYDPTTGETSAAIEVWVIDAASGSFVADYTYSL